ncbi:hypothetical protein L1049_020735 [Liquidambar formosana]|uniref:C2H2-type domain-containing protein n=1 Tax=Liquidambar formosana TaxID=63359 RepID=A0AAP0S8F6_LIQFO
MPVAKLRAYSTPDAMKSEGNDSLDTFIRQAIGKEPFLSFSRGGDSPVQWIQLLHALDQQDLPGWPLLSPLKVQMQKCDKCSREFFSPINYRRHIRVHRRSLNFDKDSTKSRNLLGAFWDKLSLDEAKEIVSFKDVTLEEVPGSSIVKALVSFIRPGFSSLPQVHVKAGSALLVKAWLADKDAEALRCQKLLVEEEEAAQKRQAELIERRRKKKLRHRELKSKEQTNAESTNLEEIVIETLEDLPSAETSSPLAASDS